MRNFAECPQAGRSGSQPARSKKKLLT